MLLLLLFVKDDDDEAPSVEVDDDDEESTSDVERPQGLAFFVVVESGIIIQALVQWNGDKVATNDSSGNNESAQAPRTLQRYIFFCRPME